MAILNEVKTALRVTSTAYDDEIKGLIIAAKSDLELTGIIPGDEDPLINRAVALYCKAHFGYDNSDADRLVQSYEGLKRQLAIAREYAYYTVTFDCGEQCLVTFNGEEKETDDDGVVVFYSKAGNHLPYSYLGESDYLDVTENTEVGGT